MAFASLLLHRYRRFAFSITSRAYGSTLSLINRLPLRSTASAATCHSRPPLAYGVHMPKKPKVVPITADEHRLIATDQRSHRLIVVIGSQRFAIDFITRITTLGSHTGDHPAAVLPMKKKKEG